jgi:hypothetical protein
MPHCEEMGEQVRNKSSPPGVPMQRMGGVGSMYSNAQSHSSSISSTLSPSALARLQISADSIALPRIFGSVSDQSLPRSGSLNDCGNAPESGGGGDGRTLPCSKGQEKFEPSNFSKIGPLVLQKVVRTESLYGIGLAVNQDGEGKMRVGKAADLQNRAGQNINSAVQEGDTLLAVDGVVCFSLV